MPEFDAAKSDLVANSSKPFTIDDVDESIGSKLLRETEMVGTGVGEAFLNTAQDPLSKAPELATAAGFGVGISALQRCGARGRAVAGAIGLGVGAKMVFDECTGNRWSNFGSALSDNWQSPANFDRNVDITRDSVGAFAVDTTIAIAGFKAAESRFGSKLLYGESSSRLRLDSQGHNSESPSILAKIRKAAAGEVTFPSRHYEQTSVPQRPTPLKNLIAEIRKASEGDIASAKDRAGAGPHMDSVNPGKSNPLGNLITELRKDKNATQPGAPAEGANFVPIPDILPSPSGPSLFKSAMAGFRGSNELINVTTGSVGELRYRGHASEAMRPGAPAKGEVTIGSGAAPGELRFPGYASEAQRLGAPTHSDYVPVPGHILPAVKVVEGESAFSHLGKGSEPITLSIPPAGELRAPGYSTPGASLLEQGGTYLPPERIVAKPFFAKFGEPLSAAERARMFEGLKDHASQTRPAAEIPSLPGEPAKADPLSAKIIEAYRAAGVNLDTKIE